MTAHLHLQRNLYTVDFAAKEAFDDAVALLLACEHGHRFLVRKDTRQLSNLSQMAVAELGGALIPGATATRMQGRE